MVDFKKVKPSENFEDRTDDTPAQKLLTNLENAFNPVSAYRKASKAIQGKLIEKGIVADPVGDAWLARIQEQIRKRHTTERAHPPDGFTINDQGIYIPTAKK